MTTEYSEAIQAEIDTATVHLKADRSDIAALMAPIVNKSVVIQKRIALLRLGYTRLGIVRDALAELVKVAEDQDNTRHLINRVSVSLQSGSALSFDEASKALDELKLLWDNDNLTALTTTLSIQGALASICLNFHQAAEYYTIAATYEQDAHQCWFYKNQSAQMLTDQGREFNNKIALEQAVDLLRNEVLLLAPQTERPIDFSITQRLLGDALGILGQRQNGTRNLEDAIAAYQGAITVLDEQQEFSHWAEVQNGLGIALGILGHRLGDEEALEKSIESLELSLKYRTQDQLPLGWATTQNNLAAMLQSVGQRKKDAKMLKRAVEGYRAVLQVWTRNEVPLDWSATMNNLGMALRVLGEYRKGPRTLEQSVAAFNSALQERERSVFPQEWAMTQNNLGASLQKLGERQEDPNIIQNAVNAYESALQEWTKEKAPMAWGMTMANLGVARRTLAEETADVIQARKAVEELVVVGDFFRNASHAQYSELCIDQLAQARKLVLQLTSSEE